MPHIFKEQKIYGLGERNSGFRARSLDGFQNFQKIRAKCFRLSLQFEDDEFPANVTSIGKVLEKGPFEWKRPRDICSVGGPRFMTKKADRYDVVQGLLGNCWLVAAIADLTLNSESSSMVIPDDNKFGKRYTGAFHFRFWQFGKWIDVVIDDRLPCTSNGKLAFISSKTTNQFWSPLLEKAYAKLYGSYGALEGGFTFEALEDFTGGFTEIFKMDSLTELNLINSPDEFYDIIRNSFEKKSVMGSSVKENINIKENLMANGLVRGHAYSITGVHMVHISKEGISGKVRLLRLRNPWGTSQEWNGHWSDGSSWWNYVSEEERTELEVLFDADGEFWMSYEDFLDNFVRIEVCHLIPISGTKIVSKLRSSKWISHSIDGSWKLGVTAGGSPNHPETFANNPQYILTIGEPGGENNTLIICLLKKDRKLELKSDKQTCVDKVSLKVFPIDENSPKPLTTKCLVDYQQKSLKQLKPLCKLREITIRFSVPSGRYVIIPFSFIADQEGDFLLRVFTEGKSSVDLYDEDVQIHENEVDVTDDTLDEISRLGKPRELYKMVAGDHEEISWWDLKLILDKTFYDEFQFEGLGFNEDICRSLVALVDSDRSRQLGFYEFTNLWKQILSWKEIFNKFDTDHSRTLGTLKTKELRNALRARGYVVNKNILEDIVLRYGNKRGEIPLDKFIVAALKLMRMIELYKDHEAHGKRRATITLREWLDYTLYS